MMFQKEIKDIQEKIESLEDEKKHLINEKIIQIFYNIKNDKNYEKIFFKKNWKVLLLCHLIELLLKNLFHLLKLDLLELYNR